MAADQYDERLLVACAQACELRPERVVLAIYLAAFLLPDGMSVMMFYDRYLEPWMRGATPRVTWMYTDWLPG